MGVQHGASAAGVHDLQMQCRFGTCFAMSSVNLSRAVYFNQIPGTDGSLIHAAGCHEELERFPLQHAAEISACAIAPAPLVNACHGLAQG